MPSSAFQPRSATSGVDAFVLANLRKHRQGLTHRDLLLSNHRYAPNAIRDALQRLVLDHQVLKCGSVYVIID